LQEANGSNGASTGMLPDAQERRARHMVKAALHRGLKPGQVVLLPHANMTGLKPEFHLGHAFFTKTLKQAGDWTVARRVAGEALGTEDIAVVIGTMAKVVKHLSVVDSKLHYLNREVGFAANPNIIPALCRLGLVRKTGDGWTLDTSIFHEGARGAAIALDKAPSNVPRRARASRRCGSRSARLGKPRLPRFWSGTAKV
jgi:hypothetical protein